MEKNIFDKVDDYLEYVKESFGDEILLEIPKDDSPVLLSPAEKTTIINKEIPKQVQAPDMQPIKKPVAEEKKELSISPDWRESKSLEELNSKINHCLECRLGATRKNFVFGTGNPNADIMVIGEAPGAAEDEQGLPFVGRAGQLLTKILESISLSRDDVYIANIVKCRPPENRRPEADEIEKCEPYLQKQIELIKPEFILSLGLTSVDTLLKKKHKMSEVRGKLLDYHGTKLMVTYHPAALLRNPNWKKFVWEDVKYLRKLYDEFLEKKGS